MRVRKILRMTSLFCVTLYIYKETWILHEIYHLKFCGMHGFSNIVGKTDLQPATILFKSRYHVTMYLLSAVINNPHYESVIYSKGLYFKSLSLSLSIYIYIYIFRVDGELGRNTCISVISKWLRLQLQTRGMTLLRKINNSCRKK